MHVVLQPGLPSRKSARTLALHLRHINTDKLIINNIVSIMMISLHHDDSNNGILDDNSNDIYLGP